MFSFAIVFLLLLNFATTDCTSCEQEFSSLVDKALDMISKAKSNLPSCDKNDRECPGECEILDCAEWYEKGYKKSGIYSVTPLTRLTNQKAFEVYCDMETDGGGWTVIQRRGNFEKPDGYLKWESYRDGFGELENDFWLGNDKIFALTNQKPYTIRFDLKEKNEPRIYAKYETFWIDSDYSNYTLHISGYSGDAAYSTNYRNKYQFATKHKTNCATRDKRAWWYNGCYKVNLNGLYNDETPTGVNWIHDIDRMTTVWTEMKIRPANFKSEYADSNSDSVLQNAVGDRYLKTYFFLQK